MMLSFTHFLFLFLFGLTVRLSFRSLSLSCLLEFCYLIHQRIIWERESMLQCRQVHALDKTVFLLSEVLTSDDKGSRLFFKIKIFFIIPLRPSLASIQNLSRDLLIMLPLCIYYDLYDPCTYQSYT